ncbi:hypothetical protein Tco_1578030 [Tanacetum coccineum]
MWFGLVVLVGVWGEFLFGCDVIVRCRYGGCGGWKYLEVGRCYVGGIQGFAVVCGGGWEVYVEVDVGSGGLVLCLWGEEGDLSKFWWNLFLWGGDFGHVWLVGCVRVGMCCRLGGIGDMVVHCWKTVWSLGGYVDMVCWLVVMCMGGIMSVFLWGIGKIEGGSEVLFWPVVALLNDA